MRSPRRWGGGGAPLGPRAHAKQAKTVLPAEAGNRPAGAHGLVLVRKHPRAAPLRVEMRRRISGCSRMWFTCESYAASSNPMRDSARNGAQLFCFRVVFVPIILIGSPFFVFAEDLGASAGIFLMIASLLVYLSLGIACLLFWSCWTFISS